MVLNLSFGTTKVTYALCEFAVVVISTYVIQKRNLNFENCSLKSHRYFFLQIIWPQDNTFRLKIH